MAKSKVKKKIGRPCKHGGFSIMVPRGELPENRKYVRQYLTEIREGLIRDIGGTEENLTTAQAILIDRIISKLGVIRCIEEYHSENKIMEGDQLAVALKESYLSYNNSIRLDLMALGIDKRRQEVLNIQDYIEIKSQKVKEDQEGEE